MHVLGSIFLNLLLILELQIFIWVRYPVWQHTFVSPSSFSRRAVVSYWRKYVHKILVNRLGGLSLPRKSVVRLTDRPDMTLDVYRGCKTTKQQYKSVFIYHSHFVFMKFKKSYCIIPGVGISKMVNFYVKVFYVMGKALTGELSFPCDRSCT